MRARATMQDKPAVPSLGSLPIPAIAPTVFSARSMIDPKLYFQDVPSSPPQSHKSASHDDSLELGSDTPRPVTKFQPADLPPHTPMQLSSPPGSPDKTMATVEKLKRKGKDGKYGGLTSSVVKGDAANSLLKLMEGRQQEE
jgi:hypothetical protein